MKRIRALVVDDSVVVRRMVREALTSDPDVDVAGVAANGRIAVAMVDQISPDVITLDIEMPEMNGLEALVEIRETHPRLPIIMFSTLTERGAVATLEALACGASDYVTKPSNVGSVTVALDRIRQELLPKVKALCGIRPEIPAPTRPLVPKQATSAARVLAQRVHTAGPIEVVAIGTSTGGPNALAEVLPNIPADFPVPIVIVQHMPPTFTRFLAERLSHDCNIEVCEAKHNDAVSAGNAWIAPGDFHMIMAREGTKVCIQTNREAQENSCRPSVDVLFRSVARVYGANTLAVVMTGMGQDGLRGSEMIRDCGGQVMVQDEATSVVWGMPGYIAQAGLADSVLPLNRIGPEIVRRVMSSARGEGANHRWA